MRLPSFLSPLPIAQLSLFAFAGASTLASATAGLYAWRNSVVWTDDAFIYFTAARNVLAGFGPVLNPGDLHGVGTSLAWTYLLAAAQWTWPEVGLPALAIGLNAILAFGSCSLMSWALRRTAGDFALLAPLGIVSIQLYRLFPGLETALAVFGVSLVLWSYFAVRSWPLTAVALAFSFFCRGDLILLGPPLVLHAVVVSRQQRPSALEPRAARAALAGTAALALGLLLQHAATGEWLPSTLTAKMIQGKLGPWARYANVAPRYLHEALAAHWTLLALAAAGAFLLRGAGATLVAAALLHWACYGWLGIADYPWYSWLLQLAARIHLVFGAAALVGILLLPIGRRLRAGAVPALIVSAAGLAAALLPRSEIARFEHEPAVGDSGFVRVYYEVAELLCADARKQASVGDRPIVLAQEVGILSHYCPDIELRDVNGLASPGMTEETLNDWAYWVRRYEPRHLVVLEHDPGERREFPAHPGSTGSRYQNILRRQAHPIAVYRRAVAGASEGGDPP